MASFLMVVLLLALLPYAILLSYVFGALHVFNKKQKSPMNEVAFSSPVSIILACYNEEAYIAEKIASLLNETNWIEGSEIIVVTGGSTDGTNGILRSFKNHSALKVFIFEERLSKIQGVNFGVSNAKHDFLVFSDFRQSIAPGSIPSLMRNFSNPTIGTVSGTLIDTKNARKPSFTRSLLNRMAINESQLSSSLNVFGALYAQRKECFVRIPENILFDDLYVTVSTLAQNKRLIQDKNAVIYDINFDTYYGKERIMRLARGLLLFLTHHFKLIRRLPLGLRLRFIVFKYLKLVLPFSLVLIVFSLTGFAFLNKNLLPLLTIIGALSLLILPFSRRIFVRCFLIHYYFGLATVLFITGRRRSVSWEKLNTTK